MDESTLSLIGRWKFPHTKFAYERDVLLKQTNLLGNTYFSNYVEWQGEAREKFLLVHPAAKEFLATNPHLAMITYCVYQRFITNSFFGDRIRIEVNSRDLEKHSLVLVFRYYNCKDNSLVAEGWQKICFSDTQKNELCSIPQIFIDLAEPVLEREQIPQQAT